MSLFLHLPLAAACLCLCLCLCAQGVSAACSTADCVTDATSDEGAFVECDMCVCDDFGTVGGSGGCSTEQDGLFDCFIKFDANTAVWSCQLRLKLGWVIGFVIMGCCLCCCLCGLITFFSHRCCQNAVKPPHHDQENEVLMASSK